MDGDSSEVGRFSIGIDGYNLAMPNGTGVATYGRVLAETLHDAHHEVTGVFGLDAGRDPGMREILFYEALGRPRVRNDQERRRFARHRNRVALNPLLGRKAIDIPQTDRVEKAALPQPLPPFDRIVTSSHLFDYAHRHFRYYRRMLPLRMAEPPAIMHWTYPIPIRLVGARNVYTIHDLVPLKLPYTTVDGKALHRKLLQACIDTAATVCTVSEASRADIIGEFGLPPEAVVNTYQCSPWRRDLPDAVLERSASTIEGVFGLEPQGYFLFFGAVEPKKNVGRLLEAFLANRFDMPLVMVGGRAWHSERELSLLPDEEALETPRGQKIADRIIRLDHLPRPLLLQLIRNACAVLFPSLYEGFGLPVLEAMQMGTPVLTSNVTSMPEIAGDAALYVDPYDSAEITTALATLNADDHLRGRLAAAGLRQAELFTQARYAARLQDMYRSVMQQPA